MIKLIESILNYWHRKDFHELEEDRQREVLLKRQRSEFKNTQEKKLNENLLKILDCPVSGLSSSQQDREVMTREYLRK